MACKSTPFDSTDWSELFLNAVVHSIMFVLENASDETTELGL